MAAAARVALNAEIPEELAERFDITRAQRGRIKKQDAVAEAIERWCNNEPGKAANQPLDTLTKLLAELNEDQREEMVNFAHLLQIDREGTIAIRVPRTYVHVIKALLDLHKRDTQERKQEQERLQERERQKQQRQGKA